MDPPLSLLSDWLGTERGCGSVRQEKSPPPLGFSPAEKVFLCLLLLPLSSQLSEPGWRLMLLFSLAPTLTPSLLLSLLRTQERLP